MKRLSATLLIISVVALGMSQANGLIDDMRDNVDFIESEVSGQDDCYTLVFGDTPLDNSEIKMTNENFYNLMSHAPTAYTKDGCRTASEDVSMSLEVLLKNGKTVEYASELLSSIQGRPGVAERWFYNAAKVTIKNARLTDVDGKEYDLENIQITITD